MKSALLVIDAQCIYTDPGSPLFCKDADKTLGHINELIACFEDKSEPMFLIRHIHKTDGSDLGRMFDFAGPNANFCYKAGTHEVEFPERLVRPRNATEIDKVRYSSFCGTDLDRLLRSQGVERVVVCGFMTNCCCDSAARHAHDLDYFVDFIIDATGTPGTKSMNQDRARATVGEFLVNGYANVLTTEQYLKSVPMHAAAVGA